MAGIRTTTEIDASPERCWEVLVDFERYPDWNPFLIRLDRRPPDRVLVHVQSGIVKVRFDTRLLRKEFPEVRWKGHFLATGVVAGEHYFRLEPLPGGRSLFIHGEEFTGALSAGAWAVIRRNTERGYELMNAAFKARCEAGTAAA